MKAHPHQFLAYLAKARFTDKESMQTLLASVMMDPQSFFADDIPSYSDETLEIANNLSKRFAEEKEPIHITADVNNPELEENSLAYHRVFGSILADDRWYWYFSTKRFIENIKAAEKNPQINAHFIHVSSGGGEAWLLDKAFDAIKNTKKPVIAFIEKVAASAGYYLSAPANKIYAYTQNDTIGSIGTMIYFFDWSPWYTKEGIVEHEHYATKSDLKNKKFNDLLNGKPEQYIKEELDPLQQQFEADVRSARAKLAALEEKHPVVRGETYATPQAIEVGLIDQMADIEDAIQDCYDRGMTWKKKQNAHSTAYSFL
jgi:ClpP class serine protease